MPLPMAPWEFSTGPTAITFTVGAQYQLLPNFKIGAVYRGETPNEFEGDLRFIWDLTNAFAPCNVLGGPLDDCGGGEQFKTTIELPRHLQLGFAWQAMENWELSFDVQWTNWSKATGFGSPLIMDLTRSQNAPNLAFTNGGAGLQGFFCVVGVCGVNQIFVNYNAQDTMTYRAGSKFDLNPTLSILAGYAYDEQFMPNRSIDLNTYDSEKHFVTGGVELKVPSAMGLWKPNLGGQVILYEDNLVGGSGTMGGLGPTADFGLQGIGLNLSPLGPVNAISFGPQQNPVELGGHIWTVGMGATLFLGAVQ